ncbi:MAG: thioredoxin-dependent thiol peroxidase [Actinomycetota bacterium]|nr:thioredoxin-dependent thiol peroxidase [Actinomycetota bacterium]
MLKPGDRAPAFALADQHGNTVRLGDHEGAKVALFFYPKADTPGCTTQACGLRDAVPDLGDTVVLGISPDPPAKQAAFAEKFELGYPLLSDPDHEVAEKYGAWGEKRMYGRTYEGIIRSAFLIDEKGTVAEAWYKISPKDTAAELRQALDRS